MTAHSQAWRWQAADKSLQLQNLPIPTIGNDQVLVRNTIAALNPVDWKFVDWGPEFWHNGHVPGVDGVGIIEAVGSDVCESLLGMRVAYHADLLRNGSFANYIALDQNRAMLIPDGVSDAEAATMPCPGLTAIQAVNKIPELMGSDILVCGGNSAVGLFAVQLLLQAGANVWVTAASESHDKLRQLGVQGCFDYRDPQWPSLLQQALPQGADGAIDLVSSEHAASLFPLLNYGAHLVAVLGRVEPLGEAFGKCVSLHEVALGASYQYANAKQVEQLKQAGERLLAQIETDGLLLPEVVEGGFAELPQLLQQLKTAAVKGKLIARM